MGGKPSKQTPADKRLKANKGMGSSAAKPAFGSKAWDAKYGIKPYGGKAKGK